MTFNLKYVTIFVIVTVTISLIIYFSTNSNSDPIITKLSCNNYESLCKKGEVCNKTTGKCEKLIPVNPINPVNPVNPVTPVTPVTPTNFNCITPCKKDEICNKKSGTCEKNLCKDVTCYNGGVCNNNSNPYSSPGFCECKKGFSGENCEIDNSRVGSCTLYWGDFNQNPTFRQTLFNKLPNSYVSFGDDDDEWSGSYECPSSSNPNPNDTNPKQNWSIDFLPCNGRGPLDNDTGKCKCKKGFSGENCEIECNNNGPFINGNCICMTPFYTGDNCDILCNNHGTPDYTNNKCKCDSEKGWIGYKCETGCSGRGNWLPKQQACQCDDPDSGTYCEIKK